MDQQCKGFRFGFGRLAKCEEQRTVVTSESVAHATIYELRSASGQSSSWNKTFLRETTEDEEYSWERCQSLEDLSFSANINFQVHYLGKPGEEKECSDFAPGAFQNLETLRKFTPRTLSLKLVSTEHDPKAPLVSSRYDRVLGVYEGGFKVWDCASDTASVFLTVCANSKPEYADIHKRVISFCSFRNLHAFDIGCGQGVCGLSVLHGLSQLMLAIESNIDISYTFQDFDEEVLLSATIPNIMANIEPLSRCDEKIKFLACSLSWDSLIKFQASDIKHEETSATPYFKPFHIAIGSDILFSPQSCTQVAQVLINNTLLFFKKNSLTNEVKDENTPLAFIGTKYHYFGTNGGLSEFEKALCTLTSQPYDKSIQLQPKITVLWRNVAMDRLVIIVSFSRG